MKADLYRARIEAGERAKLGLTLIYGPPGGGKTRFCAEGIKSPLIDRVFFFSFDRGYETLLSVKGDKGDYLLSQNDLSKLEIITTSEGENEANAGPLIRYILSNPKWAGWINPEGKRLTNPGDPQKDSYWPGLSSLTERDLVILDPLSFLGMSIHQHNMLKNPPKTKNGEIDVRTVYGRDKNQQCGILNSLQGHPFHTACLTHALMPDVEIDRSFDNIYPEFGSRNMSVLTSSWFGNVVYLHVEAGKFKAGSHPLYKPKVLARSRWEIDLSKIPNPTLADLIQLRQETN